jgi:hypothetical protein
MAVLRRFFGGVPLHRRVRAALRSHSLSDKVFSALLGALPSGISDSTLRLLNDAMFRWRARPPDDAIPSALTDSWLGDGGAVRDLERLHAMIRYRRVRGRLYTYEPGFDEKMREATAELRTFWLTSGHEVVELDQFMADVDLEFPDLYPG